MINKNIDSDWITGEKDAVVKMLKMLVTRTMMSYRDQWTGVRPEWDFEIEEVDLDISYGVRLSAGIKKVDLFNLQVTQFPGEASYMAVERKRRIWQDIVTTAMLAGFTYSYQNAVTIERSMKKAAWNVEQFPLKLEEAVEQQKERRQYEKRKLEKTANMVRVDIDNSVDITFELDRLAFIPYDKLLDNQNYEWRVLAVRGVFVHMNPLSDIPFDRRRPASFALIERLASQTKDAVRPEPLHKLSDNPNDQSAHT